MLEGDEYLSSPLDDRSKFLWYQPQIALITGIAWDHINVFPTYEAYEAPFKEFIETISPGGVLVYNAEDMRLTALAAATTNRIKKQPYSTPEYEIENGLHACLLMKDLYPWKFLEGITCQILLGHSGFAS